MGGCREVTAVKRGGICEDMRAVKGKGVYG